MWVDHLLCPRFYRSVQAVRKVKEGEGLRYKSMRRGYRGSSKGDGWLICTERERERGQNMRGLGYMFFVANNKKTIWKNIYQD